MDSKSRACLCLLPCMCTGRVLEPLTPERFWLCISSSEQCGAGVGVAKVLSRCTGTLYSGVESCEDSYSSLAARSKLIGSSWGSLSSGSCSH